MRLITDPESKQLLVFSPTISSCQRSLTIATIYRRRWEIELFFNVAKQNLRLRGFFSTTPNGVAIQIGCAICAYLLVAIAKHESALPASLHRVLQVISPSALEKVPLPELFAKSATTNQPVDILMQLEINGF